MKLLIDFSNILYGSFFSQIKTNLEFDELNKENQKNFVKQSFFSRLLYFKNKFQTGANDIIICYDHKITWRKRIFPYYKENRKKTREDSDIDFEFLFELMEEFYNDLKIFPFINLKNKYMEGDDWIAIISKYFTQNKIEHTIISSDKDFLQLHSEYAFQFSPILNQYLSVSNLDFYKKLKILIGDTKDGIPNVFSDDDALSNIEKRQKRMGEKKATQIIKENEDLGCFFEKSKLLDNYKRNRKLISFDYIPERVSEKGLKYFLKYKIESSKINVTVYFNRREMRSMEYKVDDLFQ